MAEPCRYETYSATDTMNTQLWDMRASYWLDRTFKAVQYQRPHTYHGARLLRPVRALYWGSCRRYPCAGEEVLSVERIAWSPFHCSISSTKERRITSEKFVCTSEQESMRERELLMFPFTFSHASSDFTLVPEDLIIQRYCAYRIFFG